LRAGAESKEAAPSSKIEFVQRLLSLLDALTLGRKLRRVFLSRAANDKEQEEALWLVFWKARRRW
jgi:hypothetical protein